MLKSQKLAIAASVAMAFSGQSYAVDGWSFSGDNARNEAMQTDYTNLRDSYNIWVNPALVNDYSDRIDINVTDDGAASHVSSDEEMGGAFKTFGGQTFGAYIGRPSDSGLFGTPENQFDVFWGMKMGGGVKIGARLNFQAIEHNFTGPTLTDTTPDNTLPTDPFHTTFDSSDSDSIEGSELNLAIGAAFGPNSAYEATVFIGSPDATTSSIMRTNTLNNALNGVNRTITAFDSTEVLTNGNIESDDSNMGITLRGQFGNWLGTLMYATSDTDTKEVNSAVTNFILDADVTDGALAVVNGDFSNTTTGIDTTTTTSEDTTLSLHGTRAYNPTSSTLVIFSLGLVTDETDETSQTVQTQSTFTDNITGITTYGSPIGTLGSSTTNWEGMEIPLVIALEGKVNSNWTARASIRKNLYQKDESTTTTTTYFNPTQTGLPTNPQIPQAVNVVTHNGTENIWSDTDTTVAFGGGYTEGNLTIDATLMKDFITRGTDNGVTGGFNVTYLFP